MSRKIKKASSSAFSIENQKPELTFLTYQEEFRRFRQKRRQEREAVYRNQESQSIAQYKDFTQEERQHLKNAFRYICRLAFKESNKYINKIREIFDKRNKSFVPDKLFKEKLFSLLKDAQMISGQRYFKEYLQNIGPNDQIMIVEYMIWFLQSKYLRYLKRTQCEKGKRKNMKKQLYLRFKNEVMLPYLQNHLNVLSDNK